MTFTIDCAAASDGGSLMLVLPSEFGGQTYVLNRSIQSRGTGNYNKIFGPKDEVTGEEEKALHAQLLKMKEILSKEDPCIAILDEFLFVLNNDNDAQNL